MDGREVPAVACVFLGTESPPLVSPFVFSRSVLIRPPASADARPPESGIALPAGLRRASPKRVTEYLAGRQCAAEALRDMGFDPPPPVPARADRSPAWPDGVVGSISHTDSFAWAAVAPASRLRGIGIDVEARAGGAAERIRDLVLSAGELDLARTGRLAPGAAGELLTLLAASAKESVFKCLNPVGGVFLEFHDVELVEADLARGRFTWRLAKPAGPGLPAGLQMPGRLQVLEDSVCTAVELPR